MKYRSSVGAGYAFLGATLAAAAALSPVALRATPFPARDDSRVAIEALEGLRAADMRLAGIHYRLTRANRVLCDRQTRVTGMILHQLSSYQEAYRATARTLFGFATPVAVEGAIAGSPASRAGLAIGDSIAAIAGQPVLASGSASDIAAIEDRIARQPADQPVLIDIVRSDARRAVFVDTEVACAGDVEVGVSRTLNAATDGTTIQVNSALMNLLPDDDDLAPVIAHELAHVILHHQERLTAARVNRGLLRDFGRNARLIRQTEIEADRLSVYLLANAGFDPTKASHYLKAYAGPLRVNSILAGKTHLRGEDRIALLDSEAATVIRVTPLPIIPPWISSRDQPLR